MTRNSYHYLVAKTITTKLVVIVLLGHASIQITARYYLVTDKAAVKAAPMPTLRF